MKGSLNKKVFKNLFVPEEKIYMVNDKEAFSQGSILGAWKDCGFIRNHRTPKFPDLRAVLPSTFPVAQWSFLMESSQLQLRDSGGISPHFLWSIRLSL